MNRITLGWVARHSPQGPGGRPAALIDIAQDLLLAHLFERGVPVRALEENLAEKIARLNRRTPARDVYDLLWIATTSPHSNFDLAALRRLAVMKTWVDQFGLSSPPATWRPVTGAVAYDPGRWRATRRAGDFDEQSIGRLAIPAPSLDDLGAQLRVLFEFLADLDDLEKAIIAGGAGSRGLVLDAIRNLRSGRYSGRLLH